jgi:DNA-binding Lrp family transcriptional regulator
MITSIILIHAEKARVIEAAEALVNIEGIAEVFSVSGNYDLIAIARLRTNEDLANLVTKKLITIDAVIKTETLLAFKAYSREDLEGVFSLGMK